VTKPRVAITVGDPAGIGPEISRKAAADPRVLEACVPVLYGAAEGEAAHFPPGVLSAAAARSAYDAIVEAVRDAMAGRVAAITTAPINKEAFALAGLPWPGHTELLGHLTGADHVAMMFYSEPLRVVLATIHVALKDVARVLTRETIDRIIRLTANEMPRFGYPAPRLALAGLNPHAGEHGVIGAEDDAVLAPAVADARSAGIDIVGPLPGDSVFVRAVRGDFDAVIACYHDQGLIPVKLMAFGRAVNVTLGLPIIRTSVDHGTAFDIAGRGIADHSSLVEAVLLAARLAAARASSVAGRG
jgi:4-hydroxythreonine-4-phosphate dehydrogenase